MAKTNATAAVLGSSEVNYLIYRYLQECGFHHSAFTFAHESQMHRCEIDPNLVPPAALVTYLQKGMQYLEAEANIDESGDVSAEFAILEPHEILTHNLDELRQLALERKDKRPDRAAAAASLQADKVKRKRDRTTKQRQQQQQQQDEQQANQQQADQQQQQPVQPKPEPPQQQQQQQAAAAAAAAAAANGAVVALQAAAADAAAMDVDGGADAAGGGASSSGGVEISGHETFTGHTSDPFICMWSPTDVLLATGGSGDAVTRVWNLAPGAARAPPLLLSQPTGGAGGAGGVHDITTMDWAPDGSRLACGSYDGVARIWGTDGALQQRLELHSGPIFALRWNQQGDLLLSGSADESARVTAAATGEVQQVFKYHSGATLDADWRNNNTFATCSTDATIHVCKLGDSAPIKTFRGHTNEVNSVRWDPAGRLLASCADDKTARVWSLTSDAPLAVLAGHSADIIGLRWSPAGPGSANPSAKLLLATASYDKTLKLWDVETGKVAHCLTHEEPVYAACFSPDSKYVATGTAGSLVHIWSVAQGALVTSYDTGGGGSSLEVAWSRVGDKLAVSNNNKTITVCDVRRL